MIRKARSEDKAIYIKMANEFYNTDAVISPKPISYYEKSFDHLTENDTYGDIFIFEDKNTVQGYALTAKTYSQEAGGMCLWLEEIYVLPEFRGKGIGNVFLSFIDKNFGKEYARFRLEVELENKAAIKLYKKYGFEFFPYDQMIKE